MRCRIRDLCRVNPGVARWDAIDDEELLPFLPMERVWTDRLDLSELRPKADVASGYTRFCSGDLLLPKITPTFEAGRAAIAADLPGGVGTGTTELHVLRTNEQVEPRWLLYFLNGETFLRRGHFDMYGVAGQKRISAGFVKDYPVDLPALPEQRRTVELLDRETGRIDGVIEELKRLARLVREESFGQQIELALRGVTGGVVQESGHHWMGSIPKTWRVMRLKYLARLESGHTPTRSRPELWIDCTIPWVSLNDVGALASTEFIESTVHEISEAGLAASSARVLPAGTVVVSRDATIGRCGILGRPMATSQHFADWICGPELNPRYLWLVFRTAMQPHFDSLTDGATLRTIGMPDMHQLVVPLPPLDEQNAIVVAAEAVRDREAALLDELACQVRLLLERRRALVSLAVAEGVDAIPRVA